MRADVAGQGEHDVSPVLVVTRRASQARQRELTESRYVPAGQGVEPTTTVASTGAVAVRLLTADSTGSAEAFSDRCSAEPKLAVLLSVPRTDEVRSGSSDTTEKLAVTAAAVRRLRVETTTVPVMVTLAASTPSVAASDDVNVVFCAAEKLAAPPSVSVDVKVVRSVLAKPAALRMHFAVPEVGALLPTGQASHVLVVVFANVPAGHSVQAATPPSDTLPGSHGLHTVDPALLDVPGKQATHMSSVVSAR